VNHIKSPFLKTLWGSDDAVARKQISLLVAWAFFVSLLVWFPGGSLSPVETRLVHTVVSAQGSIRQTRESLGTLAPSEIDPSGSGLIGVEWSPITTTMGSLESKQLSVDPAWAPAFRRWYLDAGLSSGEKVTILSSGSFPGLALSAIAAAESLDLDITLIASLGSSTWGANTISMPLSAILRIIRENGFVRTTPSAYTLGGGGESGGGMAPEGITALLQSASRDNIQILVADSIEEMILKKGEIAFVPGTKLVVQIGGSQADIGTNPAVLDLPPGLLFPYTEKNPGNGLIASALRLGIPVLHIIDIPQLAKEVGIPGDLSNPRKRSPARIIAAVATGAILLWKHQRWRLE